MASLLLLNFHHHESSFVNAHGSHHHHHKQHSSEKHKCQHHHHHEHEHHEHHYEHKEVNTNNNEKHQQIHRHLLETKEIHKEGDHHHHDHNLHEEKQQHQPSKLSIWMYSLGSSFGVSLLSFVGASLLFYGIRGQENGATMSNLQFILSCLAVGSLLGDCFLHLLPILYASEEHSHDSGHSHGSGGKHVHNLEASGHSFVILFGFILCLLIEVYLRVRQRREEKKEKANEVKLGGHSHHHGHSHIKAVGWINLIGDGIHNFMDGAGIAGAFQVSIPVGIANVLCICMHEIPQELSDYGILLSAGFSVKKALFFNFLSGVLSVVGCLFGLILTSDHGFEFLFINEKHLVALSAGSFMYIATSMIPIILDQLVESSELVAVPEIKNEDEKTEKKVHKDAQTSDFPTKLYYAIGSVTAGIILMHIIGVYEDSVTDMVTSFYR